MDIRELQKFLIDSNKAGYAGGEEKKWIKEPDGSTTIPFERGPWRSRDNFFGGEPYGGEVVVFNNNKAIWMMVYYGWVVDEVETELVYGVLRGALMVMPEDHPYRGPKEFKKDDFTYKNTWIGELDRFSGEEVIAQGDKVIYKANYLGGAIDKIRV